MHVREASRKLTRPRFRACDSLHLLVGVLTALAGFVYAADIVYAPADIPATGLAPIMILVLIIGGTLMLMLDHRRIRLAHL
jgi:ribose/xylose/arabinose/galactoside ABC-type transport system permease subunit